MQASAPIERVFTSRTDQIQLSMRTLSPLEGPAAFAAATAAAVFASIACPSAAPRPVSSGPDASDARLVPLVPVSRRSSAPRSGPTPDSRSATVRPVLSSSARTEAMVPTLVP